MKNKEQVKYLGELEFLDHSNRIEGEYSNQALEDAILAWKYIKDLNVECQFNVETILYVHYLLMRRLRPDIAGKLRECDVYIGGRQCIYVSETLLKDSLRELCAEIELCKRSVSYGRDNDYDLLLDRFTREMHVRFENIHPFEDGNGRVGRILMNVHRLKLGLPILIIHEGKEQQEYYKWFKEGDEI